MKPAKVVLGDIDDFVEFEDNQHYSLIYKICCCVCLLFEPQKSVLKLRKKVVTFPPPVDQAAIDASIEAALKAAHELKILRSATKIQALARGRKGRKIYRETYEACFAEIDAYWRDILQKRLDEKAKIRGLAEIRMKFVTKYVGDVIKTSVKFVVQLNAVVSIQRVWRGHWSRLKNVRVPIRNPPPLRRVQRRHGLDVLRRIWARKHYEPTGGWPGKANYLHYDMWEHADKPPKGRDYGLKTYKVIAVPRNEKEMNILQTDHNAWVGLPIAFTPFSEYVEEKRLAQRKTMSQLEFTTQTMTPYGHPVVPLSPLKSKKPVELMLRLNKESYAFATAAEKEMTAALKHQAETETEEDRRLRLKATEEGDDEQELEEDLFATGSVLQELEQQRQQQQYESDHPNEYKVSKGVVRRGARKPLSKSQRNALREKAGAGARVQVYDTESGARLNVTSKYDVCAAHLSVEEPRLKWLQELARQNNYSASQREYVKLRNQFIHKHEPFGKQQQAQQQQSAVPGGQNTLTNTSNGRVLTITKGTHRDGQGMVRTNSAWGGTNNSSTWGKIKSHVQSQMDARHAATDITARQKRGRTLDPSEFIHNMIGTGVLESDVDAYISVWGRQVYKPPKEIKSRARVWAVRPRQHYKLRYTWLPQPMLRPAVGKVFAQTHVEEEDEQQDAGDMFGGHIPVPRKKKYSTKTWYPVELNESDSAQEEEEDEEEKQKEEEKDEDGELKGGGVSGLTGEFSSSVTVDDHGRYIGSVKESPEQRSRRILSVSGLVDEDTIATMHINQLGTISLADGEGMESSSSQLLHVQQSAMLDDIQALSDWTLYADRNNNSSSNSNDTPAAVAEDSINSLPLASTKLPKEPSQSLRTTSRSLDFASDDEMNMNINAKKKASGKIMTPKPPMQAPPPHLLSNKASTWAASSTSGKSVAAAGGVSRANISPPQKHKQVSSNNTSKQPSPPRSSRSPNRSPRQSPPRSPTLSPPRTSARSPPRSPSAVPSKSLTPYSTSRTSVAGSSSARFASSFISLDSTSPSAAGQVEEQEAELERAINATADVHTGLNNIHNVHTKVKTPSFKEFVQSAKLKPYHKLERSGGTADQPYEWH